MFMARVRSLVTAYQPRPTRARPGGARDARAKLFANGRSQAVRLPKEFRLPGSEVLIHREGDRIIREPLPADPVDRYGWPIDFWDGLRQRGGCRWRRGRGDTQNSARKRPRPK